MRRDEQLDDMIEDNRQLSVKLSKAQEERDAALLQVNDLRRLMGPYSTVEIALKAMEKSSHHCMATMALQAAEEERDAANRQKDALLEAAGLALEEFAKINPYNRHDVRFPCKAETALRKAVESCAEKRVELAPDGSASPDSNIFGVKGLPGYKFDPNSGFDLSGRGVDIKAGGVESVKMNCSCPNYIGTTTDGKCNACGLEVS